MTIGVKTGDRVLVSWKIYGEAVYDKKGNPVFMPPHKHSVTGTVYYIGPELANTQVPSAVVAKCRDDKGSYFNFYPEDTRNSQKVEILK